MRWLGHYGWKGLIFSAGKCQHSSLQPNSLRQPACERLARGQAGEFLKRETLRKTQPVGVKHEPGNLSRGSAGGNRLCWHWPMNSDGDREKITCSGVPIVVPCSLTSKRERKKWIPLNCYPATLPRDTWPPPHLLSQPAHSCAAAQSYTPAELQFATLTQMWYPLCRVISIRNIEVIWTKHFPLQLYATWCSQSLRPQDRYKCYPRIQIKKPRS